MKQKTVCLKRQIFHRKTHHEMKKKQQPNNAMVVPLVVARNVYTNTFTRFRHHAFGRTRTGWINRNLFINFYYFEFSWVVWFWLKWSKLTFSVRLFLFFLARRISFSSRFLPVVSMATSEALLIVHTQQIYNKRRTHAHNNKCSIQHLHLQLAMVLLCCVIEFSVCSIGNEQSSALLCEPRHSLFLANDRYIWRIANCGQ